MLLTSSRSHMRSQFCCLFVGGISPQTKVYLCRLVSVALKQASIQKQGTSCKDPSSADSATLLLRLLAAARMQKFKGSPVLDVPL